MKNRKLKRGLLITILIFCVLWAIPVVLSKEVLELDDKARLNASGSFIALPQGITHYRIANPDSAKTVLLVHGFSVPMYIWNPTYNKLKEKGYRVISFDLFGRGFSDRPDGKYDKVFYIQQIHDLLSALKIENKVNIVGLSLGGIIVTHFTNAYPERIDKVVLIDPAHEGEKMTVLTIPFVGRLLVNAMLGLALERSQLSGFYEPDNFPGWISKYKVQMQYIGFKKALVATMNNYMEDINLQSYEQLNKLDKPVLLIWGKHDVTLPYEGNKEIREVLNCEFLTVEKAAHVPHYERPEIVNPALIHFLNN